MQGRRRTKRAPVAQLFASYRLQISPWYPGTVPGEKKAVTPSRGRPIEKQIRIRRGGGATLQTAVTAANLLQGRGTGNCNL